MKSFADGQGVTGTVNFYWACKEGHTKIVKTLVQKSTKFNIDLNTIDRESDTGFNVACMRGHSQIVDILVQKSIEFNIDLNAKDNVKGWTGFHWACKEGHTRIIETLLQKSAVFKIDLNEKCNEGMTGFDMMKDVTGLSTSAISMISEKITQSSPYYLGPPSKKKKL